MKAQAVTFDQPCHSAYEKFIEITNPLRGEALSAETHSNVEAYLEADGRELLRLLLQEQLANRGSGRVGETVCGADGVVRPHKRDHLERSYQSVLGRVQVERTGYGQRGVASLFPLDAQLNLPAQERRSRTLTEHFTLDTAECQFCGDGVVLPHSGRIFTVTRPTGTIPVEIIPAIPAKFNFINHNKQSKSINLMPRHPCQPEKP